METTERAFGPYRLRQQLCTSAAGDVFLADDFEGRDLVIRIFPGTIGDDEDRLERILYDARAASALDDPRIERTVDAGRIERRAFTAAEPMGGTSLGERLRAEGRLPVREAVRIGVELADILARAHARGVAHRGLEPAHVYLVGDARAVRLAGFGLAAAFESAPATRALDAPPSPYLAPEQVRGEHADHRADFYALGAVLWHAVTGDAPGAPPDAKRFPEDTPPVVRHLLLALLSEDPGARPAALSEFARALREILAIPEAAPAPAGEASGPAPSAGAASSPERRPPAASVSWRSALAVLGGIAVVTALRVLIKRKR
jgi:serine/threonine-protein kinase